MSESSLRKIGLDVDQRVIYEAIRYKLISLYMKTSLDFTDGADKFTQERCNLLNVNSVLVCSEEIPLKIEFSTDGRVFRCKSEFGLFEAYLYNQKIKKLLEASALYISLKIVLDSRELDTLMYMAKRNFRRSSKEQELTYVHDSSIESKYVIIFGENRIEVACREDHSCSQLIELTDLILNNRGILKVVYCLEAVYNRLGITLSSIPKGEIENLLADSTIKTDRKDIVDTAVYKNCNLIILHSSELNNGVVFNINRLPKRFIKEYINRVNTLIGLLGV